MIQELFGPVVAVYVYEDAEVDKVLSSLKDATEFGLTGAVFAQDKSFIEKVRFSTNKKFQMIIFLILLKWNNHEYERCRRRYEWCGSLSEGSLLLNFPYY